MFASTCENNTNTLDDQFMYANTQCTGITTSTLFYDSGVVVRLSFGEKLPRTQNQCTLLVAVGMGANPDRRNFYGLSFEANFQSHAFFQLK